MTESTATKRRRRAGVFDRWHTREALPDGQKCPGRECRNVTYKTASRHGVGKRWTARYVDDKGREVSQGFKNKQDAQTWLDGHTASLVRGDYVSPDRAAIEFGKLADTWVETLTNAESTRRSYESILKTHIRPRWGGVKLADIEHGDIATWIAGLKKKNGEPLSPSGVRHVHVVMRMVLDLAVRDGRMPRNLCDGVKLPPKRPATQRFLSREELARLVSAADFLTYERARKQRESWKNRTTRRSADNAHERFQPTVIEQDDDGRNIIPDAAASVDGLMIQVLGLTGIRWGELAGLKVGCVDLKRRRLDIRLSASEVGGDIVWSDTKNHTARSVAFPRSLVEPLREQIADKPGDGLVFSSRPWGSRSKKHVEGEASPVRNSVWSKRVFKHAVDLAQLAPLTPHDLRDTYASLAVGAGANVKAIQRQLGHASAAMTLDVYSGLFDDDLDGVADALEIG